MKFSDLSLDLQHQLLVNIKLVELACIAMSDTKFFVLLTASVKDKFSPLSWALVLGEMASELVHSTSEEDKDEIIRKLDEAVAESNRMGNSFLLVIENIQ